jgi:hypothetical protein
LAIGESMPDSKEVSAWPHKMPCDCVIHRDTATAPPEQAGDSEIRNILQEVCQILDVKLGPGLATWVPLIAAVRALKHQQPQPAGVSVLFDEWFQESEWYGPKSTLELIRCAQAAWKAALATAPPEQVIAVEDSVPKFAPRTVNQAEVTFDKPIIGSDGVAQTGWRAAPPEQAATSARFDDVVDAMFDDFAAGGNGHPQAKTRGMWRKELRATISAPQPQAASGGALAALVAKWRKDGRYVAEECADELEAALASHDQKVPLAAWMIANSFATGHGDTVEELLKELKWQIDELRGKVGAVEKK